jgi:hypothetical protein
MSETKYILRDKKTKKVINVGSQVRNFRGDLCVVLGFYPRPDNPASSGRVILQEEVGGGAWERYPSVINAEIVEADS